jgi:ectoine hydroxylase-related dioxygenase (phytanoyl-CoA dioxygenase family)
MSREVLRLSETDLRQFRELGYLVVEDLVDKAKLDALTSHINDEVNRHAERAVAEGLLPETYREEGFERQLARISEHDSSVWQSIWKDGFVHDSVFDVIRSPRILELAAQICDSEEIISTYGYWVRPKVPRNTTFEFPWHQDAGYAHPGCDQRMVLCVWIALVDATEERGCLWVRPYAHVPGALLPHHRSSRNPTIRISDERMAHLPRVCVPVPRGGAILMHNLTPHASGPNRSDVVRWTFDVRYQSADGPTNAAITRLPGEFVPKTPDEPHRGCIPSQPDFLLRSRARPNEVVRDAATFIRMQRSFVPEEPIDRWPRE